MNDARFDQPRADSPDPGGTGIRWFIQYTAWETFSHGTAGTDDYYKQYKRAEFQLAYWDKDQQRWRVKTNSTITKIYDPTMEATSSVGDLIRATRSASNNRWEVFAKPPTTVIVYASTYLPPVYLPYTETYDDEGIKSFAVECEVFEFDDDRLKPTGRMVDVVNLSRLPIRKQFVAATAIGGTYAVTERIPDFPLAGMARWRPTTTVTASTGTPTYKIARNWVNVDYDSNVSGALIGNFTWLKKGGTNDLFLRFPGQYLITFGAKVSVYTGNCRIAVQSSNASTGTSHTHTTDIPIPVEVHIALLPNFEPGDSLSSALGSVSDDYSLRIVAHPRPSNGAGGPSATAEKTVLLNTQAFSSETYRYCRLSLAYGASLSDVPISSTQISVSDTWIVVRPVDAFVGSLEAAMIGTDEYTGGYPGTPQWWGAGAAPYGMDENGAATVQLT